ncbi:MAG TPA: N-6 DNA methylase, partial [Polyangiaceae bacterium]|nr:N-6 DNA methylase [Polyangiaceae bacterium]
WLQHIHHHLAPNGTAGVVLANGSMSSSQSGEGEIRKAMVEADVVDIMVALPGQLFYSTQIPACLWFLARSKKPAGRYSRDRRRQVLFIDGRKMGVLVDRTRRELVDAEIERIAHTCRAWRGEKDAGEYADVLGFCKSADLDQIRVRDHVLTPGRYVGSEATIDDDTPFADRFAALQANLTEQFSEGDRLRALIRRNIERLSNGL